MEAFDVEDVITASAAGHRAPEGSLYTEQNNNFCTGIRDEPILRSDRHDRYLPQMRV